MNTNIQRVKLHPEHTQLAKQRKKHSESFQFVNESSKIQKNQVYGKLVSGNLGNKLIKQICDWAQWSRKVLTFLHNHIKYELFFLS